MKVALIHEWLTTYAGAERITEQLVKLFPDADLFALVDFLEDDQRGFIAGKRATTSFIQKLPFARKHFRKYLSLFPMAVQQLDLRGYDVVISVSHAVAHGVITGPDQMHLNICCSPMRYAWDLQEEYLQEIGMTRGPKAALARHWLHKIRLWDAGMGHTPNHVLAISHFIQRRVRKCWGRDCGVLYPPVATEDFTLTETFEDFYFTASRQVPYKHINTIVRAFAGMPDKKLVVIGDGPEHARIKASAEGCPNITVMGHQPFAVLKDHMQRCKAFVFAAQEDFGIVPLEAHACGAPVIAYGRGGAFETVRPLGSDATPTGVFFDAQTPEAIAAAVVRFEAEGNAISPAACREQAERFSESVFQAEFKAALDEVMAVLEAQRTMTRVSQTAA